MRKQEQQRVVMKRNYIIYLTSLGRSLDGIIIISHLLEIFFSPECIFVHFSREKTKGNANF